MFTYDVFDEVAGLRDIIDTFFNDIPARTTRTRELPSVSMLEGDDEIVVRALVPGVSNGDIAIHLVDTSLIIEGEKKNDYADQPYLRRERSFGKFKKSVKLPYRVDGANIKAELANGILSVRLAKSEEAKPRKIEIH